MVRLRIKDQLSGGVKKDPYHRRGNSEIMGKSTTFQKNCKGVNVPSDNEVEALAAMKALKLKVREIKKRISLSSTTDKESPSTTISALEKELKQLKREWDHWEEKRRRAAKERMILLGHEEV